jgi:neutral ceramidase
MNYRIGVGKADITGPSAELGFMGMSNPFQKGEGIHGRLFARTFVVEDMARERRFALVTADLGMCFAAVKAAVVARLAVEPALRDGGALYPEESVLIAATHTHSGPGGYSHHFLYNASVHGFNEQNFDTIVDGIVRSIVRAHGSLAPGRILLARGRLPGWTFNRSLSAYLANPEEERRARAYEVDPEMVLLKFVTSGGATLGAINWFACHPTSLGETNRLVSGDNKGYAEHFFEKAYPGAVAAFANSCCGDNSPNLKGFPDGIHDLERALETGRAQFRAAAELFDGASEELAGPIEVAYGRRDMSSIDIEGRRLRTWPAALGYGMVNGSQQDSRGLNVRAWGEGTTRANLRGDPDLLQEIMELAFPAFLNVEWPDQSRFPAGYVQGHAEKAILLHAGLARTNGFPLAPSVLPLQVVRIGALVLVGHPGEMTAMAGWRLKDAIRRVFDAGPELAVVVAAYANAYSSYTTTREEYALQHYEGASTLFGPWTLDAYIQEYARLAGAMKDGRPIDPGPVPPSVGRDRLKIHRLRATPDLKLAGWTFGDLLRDAKRQYQRGERVVVDLLGGYPGNDLRTEDTYLAVERKEGGAWTRIATDADPDTWFRWKNAGGASVLTLEWQVPAGQPSGIYRLRYFGSVWERFPRRPEAIEAASREFRIA